MSELAIGEALHKSVRVTCSPAHAFRVFTSEINLWWPPSHRKWQGSTIHFEDGPGGRFFERKSDGEEFVLGEVVDWEPPEHVIYSWNPGGGVGFTEVEIHFVLEGKDTLVKVTHRDAGEERAQEWPRRAKHFAKAWDEVLGDLSHFIERNAT